MRALLAARVITAGLLGSIAGIHLDLWAAQGYRHIPTIGPLFLLNVISGIGLGLIVLAIPRQLLQVAAVLAAGYAAATIAALLVSLNGGLFGFTESTGAPLFTPALGIEAACVISAGAGAVIARRAGRDTPAGSTPRQRRTAIGHGRH